MKTISEQIKAYRKKKKLNTHMFAWAFGMSEPSVRSWECGRRSPGKYYLAKLIKKGVIKKK